MLDLSHKSTSSSPWVLWWDQKSHLPMCSWLAGHLCEHRGASCQELWGVASFLAEVLLLPRLFAEHRGQEGNEAHRERWGVGTVCGVQRKAGHWKPLNSTKQKLVKNILELTKHVYCCNQMYPLYWSTGPFQWENKERVTKNQNSAFHIKQEYYRNVFSA